MRLVSILATLALLAATAHADRPLVIESGTTMQLPTGTPLNLEVLQVATSSNLGAATASSVTSSGAITDTGNRVFSTAGTGLARDGTNAYQIDLNIAGASCSAGFHVSAISATGTGTCTADSITGTGTTGDLSAWATSTSLGNYAGSTATPCGAGNATTNIAIGATGALTNTCSSLATLGAAAGTGTANLVPKWLNTSGGLVNSSIGDDGTTVSTGELLSWGNLNARSSINGPTQQNITIPNTSYTMGEVNTITISGSTPSFPGDLFAQVIRNNSNNIDATTHSQRTGSIAFETNVSGISGAYPVVAVGGECQASGGTQNICFEVLSGDLILDSGSNLTLNGTGVATFGGQVASLGQLVAESSGSRGLWLDGTPTDNIQSNDPSTRFNINAASANTLLFLNSTNNGLTVEIDGTLQRGPGTTGGVHVTDKDGTARPTLSGCGSGTQAVVGNDISGKVTIGTGGATACVVTFQTAFSSNASCTVGRRQGTSAITSYAVTTTTLTINGTFAAADTLDYECEDH